MWYLLMIKMALISRALVLLVLMVFHKVQQQAHSAESIVTIISASDTELASLGDESPSCLKGGAGDVIGAQPCLASSNCPPGSYCFACPAAKELQPKCIRKTATATSTFPKNTSLPFNKYAWLVTHNSFAIFGSPPRAGVPIVTFFNQEDSVTDQLNNGVRGLMLDMYDFRNDVWLCHSFEGSCYEFTAFRPAKETLAEVKAFLDANPSEVITIFIEDYVHVKNGIRNLFTNAGLMIYWMPAASMPVNGQPWPTLADMVERNHRLLVFTQDSSKEATEGVAYQWRYTTENQYGDGGMHEGSCPNRGGSPAMSDMSRSLVVQNYFPTNPNPINACKDNSHGLFDMLGTCFEASGNRWSNYVALDFYKRSTGGGAFRALDYLNGKMECGCEDVSTSCSC